MSIETKKNLALAYRILSHLKMDDLTYTHLSARVPDKECYYIYPFGLLFSEVTAENLLMVNFEGEVIEGSEIQYNRTGYVIHSAIYKARPDIHAIFHCHTHAGVAVSAMECGLLPISQFALHFYDRVGYHRYNSLALDPAEHTQVLVRDLGHYKTLLLQNHGTITCGFTIQEAMFYTYHLEQACKVQCLALQSAQSLIMPTPDICQKAVHDLLTFERDLGFRDWEALKRLLNN
jgi:ribulose-5-phosphate 4-epimerase/fuculose-1-phosphate aldolase